MVKAWVLWSPYALGTQTLLWFGHGCASCRMLWEHERQKWGTVYKPLAAAAAAATTTTTTTRRASAAPAVIVIVVAVLSWCCRGRGGGGGGGGGGISGIGGGGGGGGGGCGGAVGGGDGGCGGKRSDNHVCHCYRHWHLHVTSVIEGYWRMRSMRRSPKCPHTRTFLRRGQSTLWASDDMVHHCPATNEEALISSFFAARSFHTAFTVQGLDQDVSEEDVRVWGSAGRCRMSKAFGQHAF